MAKELIRWMKIGGFKMFKGNRRHRYYKGTLFRLNERKY